MRRQRHRHKQTYSTSWGGVKSWYSTLVGESGHYFHEHVIFPHLLKQYTFNASSKILDLGCGDGVLERKIPPEATYVGVDISPELIAQAKKKSKVETHLFFSKDVTKSFDLIERFTHAFCILAIQNMKHPEGCIKNASKHLEKNGEFVIVMNHPYFRIPRQTSWEVDEKTKLQYRRINRYLSPLEIPIEMTPGRRSKKTTWSYHYPLTQYMQWLQEAGFVVTDIQEWISDKKSQGKASKMENRAREEFPMFMALFAKKS